MIAEGRIALNGVPLDTPATLLASLDGVTVDGDPVAAPAPARLFRYHKPAGLLTAERDFTGRPTIYDNLPPGLPRVMPVGRLDLNTEGLLLLTTDGELKRALELPSVGVERSYRARAYGQVSQEQLEDLMLGIEIEGVRYGSINANIERRTGANLWIEMTLTEGKNREVRRVLEHLGLQVSRLIRTRYGPFYLGDLPPGDVDEIRQSDLTTFRTVLAKPGGGKAASNLQFSVRARVAEPRPRADSDAPQRARANAVEPERPRSRPAAPAAPRPRPAPVAERPREEGPPPGAARGRGRTLPPGTERPPRDIERPRRDAPQPRRDTDQPRRDAPQPRRDAAGPGVRARPVRPGDRRDGPAAAPRTRPDQREAARPERAPRAPQFTPRQTPGAKPYAPRETAGDVAKPARAARARAHRDTLEPRAGEIADRPRTARPPRSGSPGTGPKPKPGGKPRSGGPADGRGRPARPPRPTRTRK